MYIKITCSNEFCGCDEDFYREVKDNAEAEDVAEDCLTEEYAFREPDDRFLSMQVIFLILIMKSMRMIVNLITLA